MGEKELRAAGEGMAEATKPYHQALVSIDLAEVYVRQGRRPEARALDARLAMSDGRLLPAPVPPREPL